MILGASWDGLRASLEDPGASLEGPGASWKSLRASWEAPGEGGQRTNRAILLCGGTIAHLLRGRCPETRLDLKIQKLLNKYGFNVVLSCFSYLNSQDPLSTVLCFTTKVRIRSGRTGVTQMMNKTALACMQNRKEFSQLIAKVK